MELKGLGAASDEAVIEAIRGWASGFDGLAIICKNMPPIVDELKRLRYTGVRVMAVVSDIDSSARSAYLGIDNRAAGNVAAYLMGRHLDGRSGARVAVVVGRFSSAAMKIERSGFVRYPPAV